MSFSVSNNTNTYDYMNSFFSGLNSSSSTGNSNSATNLLGDWYSVQNGTYYKVAKKYYASEAASESSKSAETTEKELKLAKESAESAVKSITKLMDSDLYEKVAVKDEDGNTTYDYDRENILKNIKSFVDDYNDLIENTGELDDTSTLKSGVRLVNQTEVYESALAKIGITIESDNTLTIDEEAFKASDITDVKSLFTGTVSFGKNMQTKCLQVYSNASSSVNSDKSFYFSSENYKKSIANMFDSVL